MYSLEEFSKLTGLTKDTLRGYDSLLQPFRTPGGHRRYSDEHLAKLYKMGAINLTPKIDTVVYVRVSTRSQIRDLERQLDSLLSFCSSKGYVVDEIIKDIGSSVNFKRKGLSSLLKTLLFKKPKRLVIATRDRLCRIGFELLEAVCNICGTEIIVLYEDLQADTYDPIKQVVEELVHIVHLYAMKLYGHRCYKKIKSLETEVLRNVSEFNMSGQKQEA